MTFLLLFHALTEFFHQILETTECFNLRFFLIAKHGFELLFQPIFRYLMKRQVIDKIELLKIFCKCLIELIKVLLVFYQAQTREVIEVLHIAKNDVLFQALKQCEQLGKSNWKPLLPKRHKKIYQH